MGEVRQGEALAPGAWKRAPGRGVFAVVVRHEIRLMMRERMLPVAVSLLILLLGLGLYNGLSQIDLKQAIAAEMMDEERERYAFLMEKLRHLDEEAVARPPNPADAGGVGLFSGARYAVMPFLPLAPVALGQSDLVPHYYKVSSFDKTWFIDDMTLDSPWHLLRGHFDLAFVLVYLLPLFLIASSYNLLADERERGILRLLLSQPVSVRTVMLGKVAARGGAVLGTAVIVPLLAIAIARGGADGIGEFWRLWLWVSLAALYGLVWLAIVIAVSSLGRSSATNLGMLIGLWALLVLVAPVLLNKYVQTVYPTPSRVEMLTEFRDAESEIDRRYAHLNVEDRTLYQLPYIVDGKVNRQSFSLWTHLVQRELSEVSDVQERTLAAQRHRQHALTDRLAFVSPAIAAYRAMTALAGTGQKRYHAFRQQTADYHDRWRAFFYPRAMDRVPLTIEDYESGIPRFTWMEESRDAVRGGVLEGLAGLLAVACAAGAFGALRLRTYSPL